MGTNRKSAAQQACHMLLRPIASMMLKCGMTWKEFSDLSKSAFVETATKEFGIRGRPTNVSRVSILTGISRKEVKRQRDLLSTDEPVIEQKTTDATRLLSGWYQDPLYLNSDSIPALLPETGPAPSFESLCVRYGGDIPMTTMLKELLKTKAIERMGNGRLRALLRYYQPAVHDDEFLRYAAMRIKDLSETMDNNVFPDETRVPRFEGYADNDRVPLNAIPKLKKFLDERGQAFLEEIDDWLTEHVESDGTDSAECVRTGVGLYAIEDKNTMGTSK